MNKPIRLLHFADAHIDIANYGRHDPERGMPIRVLDFLHALDQIINKAIDEKVDLVIFAGDAYKDRNPQPTYQREWGQRMMRLSQAQIPTILLVGNHDVAPSIGKAHTLEEFKTFSIPHLHVADKITLFTPEQLNLPLQIISIPWISPSHLLAKQEKQGKSFDEIVTLIEQKLETAVDHILAQANPDIPLILTAHASVQGAKYGSERQVMLGHELILGGAIVNRKGIDYVALGHIHKHQELNGGVHPPIVYPGSIERIDFGEAKEAKGYVIAEILSGKTSWQFHKLDTRRFIDLKIDTPNPDTFMLDLLAQLPTPQQSTNAICRVQLSYPRDWEPLVDEKAIRDRFPDAFSLQIQKRRADHDRARLGDTVQVDELSPLDLLETYWKTIELAEEETLIMQKIAQEMLSLVEEENLL